MFTENVNSPHSTMCESKEMHVKKMSYSKIKKDFHLIAKIWCWQVRQNSPLSPDNDLHCLCPDCHSELCSVTHRDNNPHTIVQSYCIARLNHLLNRGKLTSITNSINSLSAPRGILLLGARAWMFAFQQSLNKHPLQDLSMPGSIPYVTLWFGKSL